MLTRNDIINGLERRGVAYKEFFHPPVHTIAEAENLSIPGFRMDRVPKNLFLRDDKKRSYYLVSIAPERTADLKALRHTIGSRPLSFASEDDLLSILSLEKGSVTPFGLLADSEHRTKAVFDRSFSDGVIGIHPMINTSTVFLPFQDLADILKDHGTEIIMID